MASHWHKIKHPSSIDSQALLADAQVEEAECQTMYNLDPVFATKAAAPPNAKDWCKKNKAVEAAMTVGTVGAVGVLGTTKIARTGGLPESVRVNTALKGSPFNSSPPSKVPADTSLTVRSSTDFTGEYDPLPVHDPCCCSCFPIWQWLTRCSATRKVLRKPNKAATGLTPGSSPPGSPTAKLVAKASPSLRLSSSFSILPYHQSPTSPGTPKVAPRPNTTSSRDHKKALKEASSVDGNSAFEATSAPTDNNPFEEISCPNEDSPFCQVASNTTPFYDTSAISNASAVSTNARGGGLEADGTLTFQAAQVLDCITMLDLNHLCITWADLEVLLDLGPLDASTLSALVQAGHLTLTGCQQICGKTDTVFTMTVSVGLDTQPSLSGATQGDVLRDSINNRGCNKNASNCSCNDYGCKNQGCDPDDCDAMGCANNNSLKKAHDISHEAAEVLRLLYELDLDGMEATRGGFETLLGVPVKLKWLMELVTSRHLCEFDSGASLREEERCFLTTLRANLWDPDMVEGNEDRVEGSNAWVEGSSDSVGGGAQPPAPEGAKPTPNGRNGEPPAIGLSSTGQHPTRVRAPQPPSSALRLLSEAALNVWCKLWALDLGDEVQLTVNEFERMIGEYIGVDLVLELEDAGLVRLLHNILPWEIRINKVGCPTVLSEPAVPDLFNSAVPPKPTAPDPFKQALPPRRAVPPKGYQHSGGLFDPTCYIEDSFLQPSAEVPRKASAQSYPSIPPKAGIPAKAYAPFAVPLDPSLDVDDDLRASPLPLACVLPPRHLAKGLAPAPFLPNPTATLAPRSHLAVPMPSAAMLQSAVAQPKCTNHPDFGTPFNPFAPNSYFCSEPATGQLEPAVPSKLTAPPNSATPPTPPNPSALSIPATLRIESALPNSTALLKTSQSPKKALPEFVDAMCLQPQPVRSTGRLPKAATPKDQFSACSDTLLGDDMTDDMAELWLPPATVLPPNAAVPPKHVTFCDTGIFEISPFAMSSPPPSQAPHAQQPTQQQH